MWGRGHTGDSQKSYHTNMACVLVARFVAWLVHEQSSFTERPNESRIYDVRECNTSIPASLVQTLQKHPTSPVFLLCYTPTQYRGQTACCRRMRYDASSIPLSVCARCVPYPTLCIIYSCNACLQRVLPTLEARVRSCQHPQAFRWSDRLRDIRCGRFGAPPAFFCRTK